jgi:Formin Homology 2 Domain/C2 domain of PTEN tumour-suppressor protein
MDANEDNKFINKDIKVQSKILERIKQLTENNLYDGNSSNNKLKIQVEDKELLTANKARFANPAPVEDSRLSDFSRYSENVHKSSTNVNLDSSQCKKTLNIENFENIGSEKLNIWKLNDKISILGQCSPNKTDRYSKKNNIDEIDRYLESKHSNHYLVYSFSKNSLTGKYRRALIYEDLEFSLKECLEIVKTAKLWLEMKESNKIFIEMRSGKEDVILFLASALLCHLKYHSLAADAWKKLLSSNILGFPFPYKETALRYARYFDKMQSFNENTKFEEIILHQIIITTIPDILGTQEFNPILLISTNGKKFEIKGEKCYKDDNFIIFSALNITITNDSKISIYLDHKGLNHHIFDLNLNVFFHNQGLLRFSRSEIETTLPAESIYKYFKEDFYIDVVLIENKENILKNPFSQAQNIIQDLKSISDHMYNEFSDELYARLMNLGFNRIASKFCAQMNFSKEEAESVMRSFEQKGFKNIVCSANTVHTLDTPEPQNTDLPKNVEMKRPFENKAERQKDIYNKIQNLEISDIAFISDNIIQHQSKCVQTKSPSQRGFSKKKVIEENHENCLMTARRPLHWVPLTEIEETIFNEMKGINPEIDYEKFEELFCESFKMEIKKVEESREKGVLKDSKRLFLVSLSVKHLEIRGIDCHTFEDIIINHPENLSVQDLLNVERALPLPFEEELLKKAKAEELSGTEKAMLYFSKPKDIYKILQILIFERNFFDEIHLQDEILSQMLDAFNRILDSNNLRIILKTVLDIGNAVNFKYSTRKRKADGYKLESLYIFNSYKGKENVSLFSFLIDTLDKSQTGIYSIFEELNIIHKLRNEDLIKIKEQINNHIKAYKDKLELFKTLELAEKDRFSKFFGYVCRILSDISKKYREVMFYSSLVKRKFGEDESKGVNSILVTLSDFLEKLKNEIFIKKKTQI